MIHRIRVNSDKHDRVLALVRVISGLEYEVTPTMDEYFNFSIDESLGASALPRANMATGNYRASDIIECLGSSTLHNMVNRYINMGNRHRHIDDVPTLINGFSWGGTPEGHSFWARHHRNSARIEIRRGR